MSNRSQFKQAGLRRCIGSPAPVLYTTVAAGVAEVSYGRVGADKQYTLRVVSNGMELTTLRYSTNIRADIINYLSKIK